MYSFTDFILKLLIIFKLSIPRHLEKWLVDVIQSVLLKTACLILIWSSKNINIKTKFGDLFSQSRHLAAASQAAVRGHDRCLQNTARHPTATLQSDPRTPEYFNSAGMSKRGTSVWPQHGARIAGRGRDLDPLCAVLDVVGGAWRRFWGRRKRTRWQRRQPRDGASRVRVGGALEGGHWVSDLLFLCSELSACVRVRTDQAERWRAVSLYRVMLGWCATTTTTLRSRCRASAGWGPGSDDPGAGGFRDKHTIRIHWVKKNQNNYLFSGDFLSPFPSIEKKPYYRSK